MSTEFCSAHKASFFSKFLCDLTFLHDYRFFLFPRLFFFLNSVTFSTSCPCSDHVSVSRQCIFYAFLDTFILPPVPLSSFLWQAPREIVFFTFLTKAAQSCSLLSGLLPSPRLRVLIYILDIGPFSALDNGPFTKMQQNKFIGGEWMREQEPVL